MGSFDQPHAPPQSRAGGAVEDHFNARRGKRGEHLLKAANDSANRALGRLHALDCREREAAEGGEGTLVNAEECAACSHLLAADHGDGAIGVGVGLVSRRAMASLGGMKPVLERDQDPLEGPQGKDREKARNRYPDKELHPDWRMKRQFRKEQTAAAHRSNNENDEDDRAISRIPSR